MKVSVLEFEEFLNDDKFWKDFVLEGELILDDQNIEINGDLISQKGDWFLDNIDKILDVKGGSVYDEENDPRGNKAISLQTFFRKWKRLRTERVVILKCPSELEANQVMELLKKFPKTKVIG